MTTPITALLMVLQLLASGAVELAHAREKETAPIGIEAHHDASCAVLHDAARCALCQYAGARVLPQSSRRPTVTTADVAVGQSWHPVFFQPHDEHHLSAPPRAPPSISA